MKVRAMLPKNTEYMASFNDTPYHTDKNYFTTIEVNEEDLKHERWLKHLAKTNLIKQIAEKEFVNIRIWKMIFLDPVDIQIIK